MIRTPFSSMTYYILNSLLKNNFLESFVQQSSLGFLELKSVSIRSNSIYDKCNNNTTPLIFLFITQCNDHFLENMDDDIDYLIIPPPPSQTVEKHSLDIIRRLHEAKQCIDRVSSIHQLYIYIRRLASRQRDVTVGVNVISLTRGLLATIYKYRFGGMILISRSMYG